MALPIASEFIADVIIWGCALGRRVNIVTSLSIDLPKYTVSLKIRWRILRQNITSSGCYLGAWIERPVFILKVKCFRFIQLLDSLYELVNHSVADHVC